MTLWSPQDEKTFQDLQAKRRLAEEARNGRLDALLQRTAPGYVATPLERGDLKDWLIRNADAVVDALEPFRNAGREAS